MARGSNSSAKRRGAPPNKAPARKARARRPRRRLLWGRILVLLCLINLSAGYYYSPVTGLRTVTVTGAHAWQLPLIEEELQLMLNQPFPQAPQSLVESRILQDSSLRSARLRRNIFGRGELSLVNNVPVARKDGDTSLLLSTQGTWFVWPEPPVDLPIVELPREGRLVQGTLAGPVPIREIAELAQTLATYGWKEGWRITFDLRGMIFLMTPEGCEVQLGSTEELNLKVRALAEAVRLRPDLFQQVRVINLVSPDNPVAIPRERA